MPIMIAAGQGTRRLLPSRGEGDLLRDEHLRRLRGISGYWAEQVQEAIHKSECELLDPYNKVSFIDFETVDEGLIIRVTEDLEADLDW